MDILGFRVDAHHLRRESSPTILEMKMEIKEMIESLRQRIAELEKAREICPECALKIDEAAGVDVAAINQKLSVVEKERDDWATVAESAKVRAQILSEQLAAKERTIERLRVMLKTNADWWYELSDDDKGDACMEAMK